MDLDPLVVHFLSDICEAFPEVRSRMERHDDYMTTSKMQEFAEATTEAFGRGDCVRAVEYLTFMSERVKDCNPREFEFIDVYYVENLFWPHGTRAAKIGWPMVPANLKELFLGFHSDPPI
jgi:hypothetical protein